MLPLLLCSLPKLQQKQQVPLVQLFHLLLPMLLISDRLCLCLEVHLLVEGEAVQVVVVVEHPCLQLEVLFLLLEEVLRPRVRKLEVVPCLVLEAF